MITYMIPGGGYIVDDNDNEYLIPGDGMVNEINGGELPGSAGSLFFAQG